MTTLLVGVSVRFAVAPFVGVCAVVVAELEQEQRCHHYCHRCHRRRRHWEEKVAAASFFFHSTYSICALAPAAVLPSSLVLLLFIALLSGAETKREPLAGYRSYLFSISSFFFFSTSCARFSSNGDDDGGQTKFFSLKSPISFPRDITSVHLRWLYEFRRSIGDVGDPTARRAGRPTSEAI